MIHLENQQRIESSLQRIEDKLDTHLERIAKVETKVEHQAGTIKLLVTGIVTVITSMAVWIGQKLFSTN